MEHVLENPAWQALLSGNANLAYGTSDVKYFAKEVSPFAAFRENTAGNFEVLHALVSDDHTILFITSKEIEIPPIWKVTRLINCYQMVHDRDLNPIDVSSNMVTLTDEHVPQMLALTKLTNPGPFALRTIYFGHYVGIFENGRLAAMAGQRLHPAGYAEVSAVCTHPDYTGKGYARQLLQHHITRIRAASEIPFLHVRHDNTRAISVYEDLGFAKRTEIFFYVLNKR